MTFYRYDVIEYAAHDIDGELTTPNFPNPTIILRTFELVKETPKGYWICHGFLDKLHGDKKWVSKTSRKRYAYPTKEQALINLRKRTERKIKILDRQLRFAKITLSKSFEVDKRIP